MIRFISCVRTSMPPPFLTPFKLKRVDINADDCRAAFARAGKAVTIEPPAPIPPNAADAIKLSRLFNGDFCMAKKPVAPSPPGFSCGITMSCSPPRANISTNP